MRGDRDLHLRELGRDDLRGARNDVTWNGWPSGARLGIEAAAPDVEQAVARRDVIERAAVRRPVRLVVVEQTVGHGVPLAAGRGNDDDGRDSGVAGTHGHEADPALIG